MQNEEEVVSLENLGNGAAVELFNRELQRVLDNIQDPNSLETAKRSITLTVGIKPLADRGLGGVEIACKSTLAPTQSFSTRFYFGRDAAGVVRAVEHDPKQPLLPFSGQKQQEQPVGSKVTPITQGGKGK